jgi:hypothetical protein
VRSVTPEADAVLEVFDRCYERRPSAFEAPSYQLVSLPAAGAVADQDAWTMKALAWVRDVKNRLEQDRLNDATKKRERRAEPAAEMADA